ncbi:MAG TPA: hypothetical protein VFS92_04090, partial [Planctomycetota bacterium]|nr:hypothetical protein [Planctomycetota bacterium]
MEELLQKHRTFALSAGVGGFIFLFALLLRGCAFYERDLGKARASVQEKAKNLAAPVPDEKYLKEMDRIVEQADQRVAALSREVGRTSTGEALWEECIADVLRTIGQDEATERRALMDRARKLPSAAFSILLEKVRTAFFARASQAGVEIVPREFGFEVIEEATFARSLASLAAVTRVVDRAITLGVDKIEVISVSGTAAGGGAAAAAPESFLSSQSAFFRIRGKPALLAELVKSVNDRDAAGRRL